MGSFTFISIVALFCYAFLFLTLLAAEKSKIINACLLIFGSMVLWTGGSLLMRLRVFPSVGFWYDVSILGLFLFIFGYFVFAYAFVGSKRRGQLVFWAFVLIGAWAINAATGFFLAAPTPIKLPTGTTTFLYHYTWRAGLMFPLLAAPLIHLTVMIASYLKKNEQSRQQFTPMMVGLGFLVLGHMAFFIPWFRGIPLDIVSGVLNALCVLYGLYRRHLIRMTLLVSRGSCSILAGGMSMVLFAQFITPISNFISTKFPLPESAQTLLISGLFAICTFCLYRLLKLFLDHVFVRDEIAQAERIKEFSLAISRSLNLSEILDCIVEIVQKIIGPSKMYIFIADQKSQKYILAGKSSPLESNAFYLDYNHPLAEWFRSHSECLLMSDFRRTVQYKSIWQQEKKLLESMEVECLAPLRDGDNLVGITMLSKKQGGKRYNFNDLSLLDSINSISFIAVTNSRLYSRAFTEARTDEMTGLYNRKYFYEMLEEEFEKCRGQSLALCMLSVDDLKLYNQLYGYKEGDAAVRAISEIMTGCVGENGLVARYSGKVFAIILPRYDLRSAKLLADNIRNQVANLHRTHKDFAIRSLSLSGGVAAIPYSANSVQALIEHADLAMFHVKRNGKNAVVAYTNGDYQLEKTKATFAEQKTVYSEYENTIYALMAAIDAKDHYTFNHSMNVLYYATKIAEGLNMNAEYIEIIRQAALLHDIGKIGVPEHILNKSGGLTDEEFEIMKGHVEQSIAMIKFLPSLDYVIPSVIGHHERYNGSGYPRGLKGEDIPIGARILCIADSFDAMMSTRSYKQAYPLKRALTIIEEEAGRQFDPQMATLFVDMVRSGRVLVKSGSVKEFAGLSG